MLPKDSTAFLATNVWTAGVCNRIQPAKSSETIATMIPQNIFRAFSIIASLGDQRPWLITTKILNIRWIDENSCIFAIR